MNATELLAILARDFGVTYETAVREGGATGDGDGPGERCIAAADLEAKADEECDREERWRDSA